MATMLNCFETVSISTFINKSYRNTLNNLFFYDLILKTNMFKQNIIGRNMISIKIEYVANKNMH